MEYQEVTVRVSSTGISHFIWKSTRIITCSML